jgi:AAA+ superfamily predicted ATPase
MPNELGFPNSIDHILAELERLDLLIQVQVAQARRRHGGPDEFQGLYIPENEVDALLAQPAGLPRWALDRNAPPSAEVRGALHQLASSIARRKTESTLRGVKLRLDELARLFELTPFDLDVLLICLAPELDLRYERLYAYLQDDVTKKRPSVDLVLNLLSPSFEAKLAARNRFLPPAPLILHHLVTLFDDPSQPYPPLLRKYLRVDDRIVAYLLDSDELDPRVRPYAVHTAAPTRLDELNLPVDLKGRLVSLVQGQAQGLILYFQGSYGMGKQATAEALCRELGQGLLVVAGERLTEARQESFQTVARLTCREALLQGAALYWDGFDVLFPDERRSALHALLAELAGRPGLTFLAGEATWEPVDALATHTFVRVEFPRPAYADRLNLWRAALNSALPLDPGADLPAVAAKFRFSGGQIRDAAATAANLARWRDPSNSQISAADLYAASRLHSNRKLASLAQKITPHYTWTDIVLPPDRLAQLRELCNSVKYRVQVYDDWGFDRKLALGKGLSALFAGPSGTGKTMAAEIIAHELGLDLYKIDLSSVVSKYIGETEKNLARIFVEAETSNAILFFDEADALFGKRSEVRDAHDRYANIEIAYLLQKMDEYEGVVILATNLRKNMDEAFVRRVHFTVEFPFPTEADRRRIWEQIWPTETPRRADLDLVAMARRFELAGGSIRNIAVAAAFLAADNGQEVDMSHLLQAARREFQKMGKVVEETAFS